MGSMTIDHTRNGHACCNRTVQGEPGGKTYRSCHLVRNNQKTIATRKYAILICQRRVML